MSEPDDKSHEERQAELAEKLHDVIRQVQESIGFWAYIEAEVSLYPDGKKLTVSLVDPHAEREAKERGDSDWEPLIEWKLFNSADGDLLQQAVAWVRSESTPEILRQKRQAELQDAIDYFLSCGEEPPPGSIPQRRRRAMFDYLPDKEDRKDKPPPKKLKPRQGPPPPDMSLRNNFSACVWFVLPDELEVRLTEGRSKRDVAKLRHFKLPESGSLAEVFAWIRAVDEQHEPTGGAS